MGGKKKVANDQILAGCHIALTGALSEVRSKIVADIQSKGGTFSASVTANTTHLVMANPYMQTTKAAAAKAKGVVLVDESFLQTGAVQQVFQAEDAVAKEADDDKVVTFEYLENGNWRPYDASAHGIVEAAFQDWLQDPLVAHRPVKSGYYIYKVDFGGDCFTQTNMQVPPHTIRPIRRVVGGGLEIMEKYDPNEAKKKKPAAKKPAAKKRSRKKTSDIDDDEDEDEEEEEVKKPTKKKAATKKKAVATKKKKKADALFDGIVFAISGKLENPRSHYEKLINDNGGTLAKSLTKAVTHLITVDGAQSSAKIYQARKRGCHILSEEFLSDAIDDGEVPDVLDAYEIDE